MVDVVDRTQTCQVDASGEVASDFTASSRDGCVQVQIEAGTSAEDADGDPLTYLDISPVDPLPDPPEGHYVLAAFDFSPDGASFSPAMKITLCYDPGDIPDGMSEDHIVIAIYDEDSGEWEFLSGTVNPDDNTITFSTRSFSIYGVLAAPASATPTPGEPTPTPAPTKTTKPGKGGGGISTGVIVAIVVVVVVLLLIGGGIWLMKRKKMTFKDVWDKLNQ